MLAIHSLSERDLRWGSPSCHSCRTRYRIHAQGRALRRQPGSDGRTSAASCSAHCKASCRRARHMAAGRSPASTSVVCQRKARVPSAHLVCVHAILAGFPWHFSIMRQGTEDSTRRVRAPCGGRSTCRPERRGCRTPSIGGGMWSAGRSQRRASGKADRALPMAGLVAGVAAEQLTIAALLAGWMCWRRFCPTCKQDHHHTPRRLPA